MKKDENMDYLFKAILSLRTEDECYAFFEDLCTPQELKAISQRLHVAKLLTDNCVYNDIVKKTGASMTAGMGFYGETRKNAAIPECISRDRKFRRRTSGTDVCIAACS